MKESNLIMDKHLDLGWLEILMESGIEIESFGRFDVGMISIEGSLDIISFTGFVHDTFLVENLESLLWSLSLDERLE